MEPAARLDEREQPGRLRAVGMERVHVPKTAEVVAQAIRSQIVRGEIPEGSALPGEAELMTQFGVSRPSLREAFRILESEQLITVRRGSRGGARVMRPDITVASRYLGLLMQVDGVLLSDVFQARALIEPVALRLVAQREDRGAAAEQLTAVFDRLDPGLSPRQRAEVWLGFYLLLFELAGNKTLQLLYGTLTEVLRHELLDSMSDAADHQRDIPAMKAVKKAMRLVAAGKGDDAANFWRNQMFLLEERMERVHQSKTVVDAITNGS
ncbi:FadR/GntR family transcriptional regulator [Pseudonocardia kunmingensis]|uniref:GntR family transcriptional regulator n=1 Tax=Pseudonocardia kunmingensis TaxID=630975 RepID=A0A543DPK5_9PSEU|nr:GntR family transcriptional regulator [Pseudonocardia kunmingensis]TQM11223.1 GntR family transcriptional regulator [Pseudonocardia kunmingensis]